MPELGLSAGRLLNDEDAEKMVNADPRIAAIAVVLAGFYGGSAERSITAAVLAVRALDDLTPRGRNER
jgi:hypothetical protein